MRNASILMLVMFGVSACAPAPDESVGGEPHLGQTSEALGPHCPSWGCGENSPILGPFDLHELEESGLPNSAGMQLLGFRRKGDNVTYHVNVIKDALTASDPTTGVTLSGTALIDGALIVQYPAKGTLDAGTAEIKINNVSKDLSFWQGPATPIETYELTYTGADTPKKEYFALCRNPPLPPPASGPGDEGHVAPNGFQAILYTGDRYDADQKLVTASDYASAGNWFNIACAGGALMKLHLNRHTTASSTGTFTTTAAQRQTMLKMYTGDFCGTGEAFTEQGTRIHWSSSTGLSSPLGNSASYESLWNANGAECLSTHRLKGISTFDYQAEIQGVHAVFPAHTIRGRCPKPACSPLAITMFGHSRGGPYLMTQSAALP